MAGAFSGESPMLKQYAKRKTSLCKDFFIFKHCTKGEACHFAHKAPPINENWKLKYCPEYFNGTCERGILCNFMHHPNKIRKPVRLLYGEELILELERLNPYGYYKEIAMSPDGQEIQKSTQKFDDVTKKLEKVQLR